MEASTFRSEFIILKNVIELIFGFRYKIRTNDIDLYKLSSVALHDIIYNGPEIWYGYLKNILPSEQGGISYLLNDYKYLRNSEDTNGD